MLVRTAPVRPSRRLILIDAENLAGGPIHCPRAAAWVRENVHARLSLTCNDLVVVATGHYDLLPTFLGWPGPRYVCGSGRDGADLALLDELASDAYLARFDEIVIGSGDHVFVDRVVELGRLGIQVAVLAPRNGIAKRLQMAATRTIFLDNTYATARTMPEIA